MTDRAQSNVTPCLPPAKRRGFGSAIAWRAALLLPLALAACEPSVISPRGIVGITQRTLLIDSLLIMLAIILPTIAATLAFAFWYRESNTRATYRPRFAYSGKLEAIVWAIPLLTITLLGGVAWVSSHELDPAKPLASDKPAMQVQVVSLDWKWLFIYPDQHVASVNELVMPAGVPVHFSLTSASVMNAFFIPSLGSMIYVMNGMADNLNLQADQPGTFEGLSSHYSGDGFSTMRFAARSLPADQLASWFDTARANGPALDEKSYAELMKQTSGVAPFTYRSVDPDLFNKIVTQKIAPAAGPTPETNPGAPAIAEN